MRRLLTLAALIAATTIAAAQAPPNFAGKWTLIPDPNATGGGMGGLGQEATITQDGSTITITRTTQMGTFTSIYKLDGTESKNTMMGRGGTPSEAVSVAKFDGGKLTITTKRDMGGQMVETTETWSVAGSVLTIESTGGRGPAKRVYKKTT